MEGESADTERLLDPKKAKEDALNEKPVKMSQKTKNKLYLYLFHLFESLISNVTQLVQKSVNTCFAQIGLKDDLNSKLDQIKGTINTIATDSEAITTIKAEGETSKESGAAQPGFFSENAR
jgi:phage-related tail protein